MQNCNHTIHLPLNLFRDILAAAREQLGTAHLIEIIVGETEPLPEAKPNPAKSDKANKLIKVKIGVPPTPAELEAMLLARAQADGIVQAAEFYDWWPGERKKAKAKVSAVLGKLVQAGKLIKEGHAQHTRYMLRMT